MTRAELFLIISDLLYLETDSPSKERMKQVRLLLELDPQTSRHLFRMVPHHQLREVLKPVRLLPSVLSRLTSEADQLFVLGQADARLPSLGRSFQQTAGQAR